MKLLCHALDMTLRRFKIKAHELSAASGVATGSISNFRNDSAGITTDSLEKLLDELSEEQFIFWLSQVAHARGIEEFMKEPIALNSFISRLDDAQTAELLMALAKRARSKSSKKVPV